MMSCIYKTRFLVVAVIKKQELYENHCKADEGGWVQSARLEKLYRTDRHTAS